MKVRCEEVFGPVVTVSPYETFEDALARGERLEVRACRRACSRTTWTARCWRTARCEVGGVIVNDAERVPGRPDAVRRVEGHRLRPRGPAVRDGGDDRAAHPGPVARPAVAVESRRDDAGAPRRMVSVHSLSTDYDVAHFAAITSPRIYEKERVLG